MKDVAHSFARLRGMVNLKKHEEHNTPLIKTITLSMVTA